MNNLRLTIVVPVYEVEEYIETCISSLLVCNRTDYEILIVNDGTKDRSIEVVKEKFTDPRIRIIEQQNAGLSAARNLGLAQARGEYIWFFDSDDWAETKEIPLIIEELHDVDFVFFNSYFINYDHKDTQIIIELKGRPTTIEELIKSKYFFCTPYYIFRKAFLQQNNLCFEVGILHEDSLFTPIMITYAKAIKCFNKPVYHHRFREGSITHSKASPKRIMDLMYILKMLVDFGDNYVDSAIRLKWGVCIAQIINSVMFLSQNCEDRSVVTALRNFINHDTRLLHYLKEAGINNKIMRLIAKLYFNRLFDVYSFLYRLRYYSRN
ncbi:MAG: glycosyltransferase [Bacteroidaceae bacterium]|nr:glycosyltransferase [Bacteroidaceae bacterium]